VRFSIASARPVVVVDGGGVHARGHELLCVIGTKLCHRYRRERGRRARGFESVWMLPVEQAVGELLGGVVRVGRSLARTGDQLVACDLDLAGRERRGHHAVGQDGPGGVEGAADRMESDCAPVVVRLDGDRAAERGGALPHRGTGELPRAALAREQQ